MQTFRNDYKLEKKKKLVNNHYLQSTVESSNLQFNIFTWVHHQTLLKIKLKSKKIKKNLHNKKYNNNLKLLIINFYCILIYNPII